MRVVRFSVRAVWVWMVSEIDWICCSNLLCKSMVSASTVVLARSEILSVKPWMIFSSSLSVRRKVTAEMMFVCLLGSLVSTTTEKRVRARVTSAITLPGRHHPVENRWALASWAFLIAPGIALTKLWAAGRGIDEVIDGVRGALPAIVVWGEDVVGLWIGFGAVNKWFKILWMCKIQSRKSYLLLLLAETHPKSNQLSGGKWQRSVQEFK